MGAIECERNKYYKVATETQRWVEESQEQIDIDAKYANKEDIQNVAV